jgi:hypothetical protein
MLKYVLIGLILLCLLLLVACRFKKWEGFKWTRWTTFAVLGSLAVFLIIFGWYFSFGENEEYYSNYRGAYVFAYNFDNGNHPDSVTAPLFKTVNIVNPGESSYALKQIPLVSEGDVNKQYNIGLGDAVEPGSTYSFSVWHTHNSEWSSEIQPFYIKYSVSSESKFLDVADEIVDNKILGEEGTNWYLLQGTVSIPEDAESVEWLLGYPARTTSGVGYWTGLGIKRYMPSISDFTVTRGLRCFLSSRHPHSYNEDQIIWKDLSLSGNDHTFGDVPDVDAYKGLRFDSLVCDNTDLINTSSLEQFTVGFLYQWEAWSDDPTTSVSDLLKIKVDYDSDDSHYPIRIRVVNDTLVVTFKQQDYASKISVKYALGAAAESQGPAEEEGTEKKSVFGGQALLTVMYQKKDMSEVWEVWKDDVRIAYAVSAYTDIDKTTPEKWTWSSGGGRVGAIYVYNRVLEESEILSNKMYLMKQFNSIDPPLVDTQDGGETSNTAAEASTETSNATECEMLLAEVENAYKNIESPFAEDHTNEAIGKMTSLYGCMGTTNMSMSETRAASLEGIKQKINDSYSFYNTPAEEPQFDTPAPPPPEEEQHVVVPSEENVSKTKQELQCRSQFTEKPCECIPFGPNNDYSFCGYRQSGLTFECDSGCCSPVCNDGGLAIPSEVYPEPEIPSNITVNDDNSSAAVTDTDTQNTYNYNTYNKPSETQNTQVEQNTQNMNLALQRNYMNYGNNTTSPTFYQPSQTAQPTQTIASNDPPPPEAAKPFVLLSRMDPSEYETLTPQQAADVLDDTTFNRVPEEMYNERLPEECGPPDPTQYIRRQDIENVLWKH